VSLSLFVTNFGTSPVRLERVAFVLPVGKGPGALTANPSAVSTGSLLGTSWSIRSDGTGDLVALPNGPSGRETVLAPGESLAFSAQNIEVVDLPGWAPIQLWSSNGTANTQYPSIGVAIVPQQLSIRSLSAVPLAVMSGQPVTLSWRTMGAARATLSANGGTRPVDPTS
jgi:hypothetical protein